MQRQHHSVVHGLAGCGSEVFPVASQWQCRWALPRTVLSDMACGGRLSCRVVARLIRFTTAVEIRVFMACGPTATPDGAAGRTRATTTGNETHSHMSTIESRVSVTRTVKKRRESVNGRYASRLKRAAPDHARDTSPEHARPPDLYHYPLALKAHGSTDLTT